MSTEYLSLIMDFVVLAALAGTIYFALRLSKSLNNFRKYKEDMKELMSELNHNINDAQNAIDSLRSTGNLAAGGLEDLLHDSKRMSQELKMINETSDNLAGRLENAALRTTGQEVYEESYGDDDFSPRKTDDDIPEPPSFFIRDTQIDEDEPSTDESMSDAEKELMQALKSNKKKRAGG